MKRVIIYGFGEAGRQVADDILRKNLYEIVGFLDDDKSKFHSEYKNLKVLGDINVLESLKVKIDVLIIAMPSASIERIIEIEKIAFKIGIKDIRIVPKFYVREEKVYLRHVVEVDIVDIFKKKEIEINYESLKNFYKGKRILITGCAGSIGSNLLREILNFDVEKVVGFDIDETRLYELENDVSDSRFEIFLGDITDDYCLKEIFKENFDIVFHAAAYKHVPILEKFPYMANKVNVIGTKKLVNYSKLKGIEKFIFISTDKAVEPISVMGKTKKIAEEYVVNNGYTSIRFGNVINSRGSLIPTILKQIQRGYVKITDVNAKRYFITPKEAILLTLNSVIISRGGDILMFDMGEAIPIKNLVEEIVRTLGYEPYKDIKFIFTGLREGEKLEEKLINDDEIIERTENPHIFRVLKNKN